MERACFKPFVRPKGVARLAKHSFATAEMIAALGISEPAWDSWTRGREALALVAPKGRGKAGRAFPVIDAWALAVYGALIGLTGVAAPMRRAIGRLLESDVQRRGEGDPDIAAKLAADPFEAPPMWWARDSKRPWWLIIDADMLEREKAAIRAGSAFDLPTVDQWFDDPHLHSAWPLHLPTHGHVLNVSHLLREVDARLLGIVRARK